jgi:N-acetylglucosaminyldiphosphoundecaprenol N-acetyl-beta-D-mannosaminyltransferase
MLVKQMTEDGKKHRIVLLDFKKLMKSLFSREYRNFLCSASMILPVSLSICRGINFLYKFRIKRTMPFQFAIELMGSLEKYGKTMYLLGSKRQVLQVAAVNLRDSFPGLRIVGRCTGYFKKPMEKNIIKACQKAQPSLILGGRGLPKKELWFYRNSGDLNPGISLWFDNCYEIFAGTKPKTNQKLWDKGMDFLPELIKKPWRIFCVFRYILFYLILIIYKIRKK